MYLIKKNFREQKKFLIINNKNLKIKIYLK